MRSCFSTKPDFTTERADEVLNFFGIMGERRHHAPDRTRPRDVVRTARDHVDVQLRYQIAERRDIQLVSLGNILKSSRDATIISHQLRLHYLLAVANLLVFDP